MNFLFDLDGTLIDSAEGICRCINYALEKLDQSLIPAEQLRFCLGPPLRSVFRRLLDTDDMERIEKGVALYRERFAAKGLYECTVYPGIEETLIELQNQGASIYLVTSKVKIYAERIIEHLDFTRFFSGIYGPELGGRFDNKEELVEHLLDVEQIDPKEAVFIGDRREDIAAGKKNDLRTIGVLYGYGTKNELLEAGADQLCCNPQETAAACRREMTERSLISN